MKKYKVTYKEFFKGESTEKFFIHESRTNRFKMKLEIDEILKSMNKKNVINTYVNHKFISF